MSKFTKVTLRIILLATVVITTLVTMNIHRIFEYRYLYSIPAAYIITNNEGATSYCGILNLRGALRNTDTLPNDYALVLPRSFNFEFGNETIISYISGQERVRLRSSLFGTEIGSWNIIPTAHRTHSKELPARSEVVISLREAREVLYTAMQRGMAFPCRTDGIPIRAPSPSYYWYRVTE